MGRVLSKKGGGVAWWRVGITFLLAIALGVVAFALAGNPTQAEIYQICLHAFELTLGGAIGFVMGDFANN